MKSLDGDQDFNNPPEHLEVEQKGGGGAGAKAERRCLFLPSAAEAKGRMNPPYPRLRLAIKCEHLAEGLSRAGIPPPPTSNQTRRFPGRISKKN